VFGVVVLDTDTDEAVLKASNASLSANPQAYADNVPIGKARILAGTSAAHSVLGSYRHGVRCVVCREMVSPAYGAHGDNGFVCEACADKAVRDAEFANGQTDADDVDGDFGALTFGPDGQPQLVEAPQLVEVEADDETEDEAEAAADTARLAETAAYEAHKVLSDAEMEADDAAWAAEEAARVYDPPIAGLYARTDVMGSRMWAADRAWDRRVDCEPWQGWTLLDEGDTSGTGAVFAPVPGETVLGFRDQQGGEWIAVGHGSTRDPDGSGNYTPSEWGITEVTGRYEQGLKDANGGFKMRYQHFHRGPDRVSSPATIKVAAELGDRWTPAYMTTYMSNLGDSRFDEWNPAETITLFSESGHVLATQRNIYSGSGSKNGQAGVGLTQARKAGWTDMLNVRVKDATFSHHEGARIPVSVKNADGFADWLGDSVPGVPTMDWLDQGGLKALAATTAFGRQLMGPAAA
jgi:hypothetical protein